MFVFRRMILLALLALIAGARIAAAGAPGTTVVPITIDGVR